MAIPASPETERRILLYRLMLINLNMYTAICLSWVNQAHRFRSTRNAGRSSRGQRCITIKVGLIALGHNQAVAAHRSPDNHVPTRRQVRGQLCAVGGNTLLPANGHGGCRTASSRARDFTDTSALLRAALRCA
jgi:hypothetical protein